ncbi:uncharacterized protein LOC116603099 [Nematostella vectensis]|uniref:uncharacterized protein LOC116603099 n=1 Tax=Nematostella vectensis TaxID=45351 RepID=UPI0020773BC8|nr:uncharacterized protein LOC116603099 [Nematostella vectensis]
MSDILQRTDPFFEFLLTESDSRYEHKQRLAENDVTGYITLPRPLLAGWYLIKTKDIRYIDLLNKSIGATLKISSESVLLEKRLDDLCRRSSAQKKKLNVRGSGKPRFDFCNSACKVRLLRKEVVEIKDLVEERVEETSSIAERDELVTALKQEVQRLKGNNDSLRQQIRHLKRETCDANVGTPIPELKTEQSKNRKIKILKNKAEKALAFVELFGLELDFLQVTDSVNEKNYNLDLSTACQGGSKTTGQNAQYLSLNEKDKATVESVLFLMDKFGVGDDFIQKVSRIVDGFPRGYIIKQCRSELNKQCNIRPTPGQVPGAQFSFKERLVEQIKSLRASGMVTDHVRIKLSGDGARMSRSSNFTLFSFAILNAPDDLLSSKGTHTVAVINGPEKYETIAESLKDVLEEIDAVQDDSYVELDGKKINVEFFLGGDYKFLLQTMGLSAANSAYACLWCKVHKKDRGDMSKDDEYYEKDPLRRTLQDIIECGKRTKGENYCCVNKPLFNIEPDHILIDELHLMLRVTDILIDNAIEDAMQWDEKEKISKRSNKGSTSHLSQLVQTIRSCGVSFQVWEKLNADGRGSGTYDFTSLMGSDRKKLLKKLPEKLIGVLQPSTAARVAEIWKDFHHLYFDCVSNWKPPSMEVYQKEAKEWITKFGSLGDVRLGYKKERVTCYMHVAAYHVPPMIRRYQNLKQFSGQGLEKNNDDARRVVLRKSNHLDDPCEVLQAEFRLGKLKHREKLPRPYVKRNA